MSRSGLPQRATLLLAGAVFGAIVGGSAIAFALPSMTGGNVVLEPGDQLYITCKSPGVMTAKIPVGGSGQTLMACERH
ncbi:MAG TPA: hypothetical protein VNT30_00730 [Stellaceae bacterium]|nr:hypothetical protein [Stellaceae bacterium]